MYAQRHSRTPHTYTHSLANTHVQHEHTHNTRTATSSHDMKPTKHQLAVYSI